MQNTQELSPYKVSTETLADHVGETDKLASHAQKEKHISVGQFIKSAVYGGLDGLITTLTIVLSGKSSNQDTHHILAFGFSSLLGNAVSMAFADFLGSKSDEQYMLLEKERQTQEIKTDFQGQKKQMLLIYQELGLEAKVSQEIVDILSGNKEGFLKVMMIEELQLISQENALMNAFKNSLVTFFSFAIFGLMPLIPVIVAYTHHSSVTNAYFAASIVVSAFFLFILGFSKSFVTGIKWYISVIETIIIGAVAAGVAYGIGRALE